MFQLAAMRKTCLRNFSTAGFTQVVFTLDSLEIGSSGGGGAMTHLPTPARSAFQTACEASTASAGTTSARTAARGSPGSARREGRTRSWCSSE